MGVAALGVGPRLLRVEVGALVVGQPGRVDAGRVGDGQEVEADHGRRVGLREEAALPGAESEPCAP